MCTEWATPMAVSSVGMLLKLMSSSQPTTAMKATARDHAQLYTTIVGASTPTTERK